MLGGLEEVFREYMVARDFQRKYLGQNTMEAT